MRSQIDDFDDFYASATTFSFYDLGWPLFFPASPAQSAHAAAASTTVAPVAAATAASTNPVLADMIAAEIDGSLSYAGALKALEDAAAQPMTATLFADLQAAANDLNVAGGVATSILVVQSFDNVVLGDAANAQWNGGASTPTALGDLSAASTQTQFDELIGKWFLGSDLPGDASAPGASAAGIIYRNYSLPLFTSAGPQITDVNQGQLGDCWFLAAVGETALLDPALIDKIMIVHNNGMVSVKFEVDGAPDFVTVDDALPTYDNGAYQFDGSFMVNANSTTSLWVPLLEKALAQLSEQTGVVTGMEYSGNQDQYYDLNAGEGEGITLLTGQQTQSYSLRRLGSSGLTALLGEMQSDLAAGDDVLLGTSSQNVSGELVADHMFAVTAINASAGAVTLYNPWGANGVGEGKAASFTIAASALVSDNAAFYAAV